jgi:hypothetical protein
MFFKKVIIEINYLNRYIGSSITLSDLIILSYKRFNKSYWMFIIRIISNQDSVDELLISIINILYLEIKVIFKLRRIVNIATRDYLILSTQTLYW